MGRLATAKAIHICNSHEPTLDQKLQKSMSVQRAERQIEITRYTPPIKAISNASKIDKIKNNFNLHIDHNSINHIWTENQYSLFWKSTITYQYTDSFKIKTQINNTEALFGNSTPKTVTTFDTNNRLISSCSYTDSIETYANYSYRMVNGHLTEIKMEFPDGRKRIKKLTFNDDGLLTEERHFLEGKIIRLIRYYYEK
jgi:hypothetical protein